MRSLIKSSLFVVIFLAGCERAATESAPNVGRQSSASPAPAGKVIKVAVAANGDIKADGESVTLEQLAAKLAAIKAVEGAVYYHREKPAGEPHPNAMKVVAMVVENKLPIRMSTKPDFSDSIEED